ncbi:MAG: hypothetical protein QF464_15725, partial [Myxococcota bacterium]|nr:hypothetical protein [Myxococcota bacterium]
MTSRMSLSRRTMLKVVTFGGAAIWARNYTPAFADGQSFDTSTCPLFVYASFAGGWDTLLGPDPRDATQWGAGSGIDPAWESARGSIEQSLSVDVGDAGLYEAAPGFVVGPAMANLAKDHWQDLCIVRGVDMGTLTHDVG